MMLVQYLLDAGEQVEVPGVAAPKTTFEDAAEPVALALEQEKTVTKQIAGLVELAREENDFVGEQFLLLVPAGAARGGLEHVGPARRREACRESNSCSPRTTWRGTRSATGRAGSGRSRPPPAARSSSSGRRRPRRATGPTSASAPLTLLGHDSGSVDTIRHCSDPAVAVSDPRRRLIRDDPVGRSARGGEAWIESHVDVTARSSSRTSAGGRRSCACHGRGRCLVQGVAPVHGFDAD